jgi:hypothetical protein
MPCMYDRTQALVVLSHKNKRRLSQPPSVKHSDYLRYN